MVYEGRTKNKSRANMITIQKLSVIRYEMIHEVFIKAFADYVVPMNLSIHQFKSMLERGGCNLDLSFGAFNNNELVGFVLNGIRQWNGKLTAYDTGSGIIQEFRNKGIASKIFNESLPIFRENNISQYLLEVICTNTPAYNLYKKMGFEVTRKLDCYKSPKDKIEIRRELDNNYPIREIVNPDWELLRTFWDVTPSWQNSIDSISRKLDRFIILGIFNDDNLAGYCIFAKKTGYIPQFGIDKKHRRKGLFTTLFQRIVQDAESDEIIINNICSSCDTFMKFTNSINIAPTVSQHEMLLKLV